MGQLKCNLAEEYMEEVAYFGSSDVILFQHMVRKELT